MENRLKRLLEKYEAAIWRLSLLAFLVIVVSGIFVMGNGRYVGVSQGTSRVVSYILFVIALSSSVILVFTSPRYRLMSLGILAFYLVFFLIPRL